MSGVGWAGKLAAKAVFSGGKHGLFYPRPSGMIGADSHPKSLNP
jgi:hypothetical protein